MKLERTTTKSKKIVSLKEYILTKNVNYNIFNFFREMGLILNQMYKIKATEIDSQSKHDDFFPIVSIWTIWITAFR